MEKRSVQTYLVLSVLCLFLTGTAAIPVQAQVSSLDDTTAPVITSFIVPASTTSRTVAIKSFTARDNFGIVYFAIRADSAIPADSEWKLTAPIYYKIPNCVPGGTVRLRGWVKDATGNLGSMDASVTGVPNVTSAPDLAVTAASTSDTTVTTLRRTLTVTDTVANQGNATASSSRNIYQLYKQMWWSGAILTVDLIGTRFVPTLMAGKTSKGMATVVVPADTSAGNWNLRVCADGANTVDELNEKNCRYVSGITVQE